jgi:hypothetical protein
MTRIISLASVTLLMTTMLVIVVIVMASAALAQEPIICTSANTHVPPQGDAALATHARPHACD